MTATKDHRFDDPRTEAVELIPLRELRRAPWNARKSFDPASIAELRASIQQHGVQVPLIVRPLSSLSDILQNPEQAAASGRGFEIVAGHRRFEAALNGGTKGGEVPCIVRALDDRMAREIALIDNLQREDVPAMEEAAAFEELLKTLGSIAAVAAKVGKEQAYIAKRLKLCTLTDCGRLALSEGLITVDHALLLARLGADEQDAALKWCLDRNAGSKTPVDKVIADRVARRKEQEDDAEEGARWRNTWEPATVQSLKDHIASETGIELSRAPWELDFPALVPDAPACNECPQNTKANAPLFADLAIGEATCTDGGCFKEKTQAFVRLQARIGEQDAAGGTAKQGSAAPLRVSWKSTATAPRMEKDGSGPSLTQVFKDGQWVEAKQKSCEHVRAAVTVDWDDANNRGYMGKDKKLRKPGEIIQVCVQPKCKAHKKAFEKSSSNGNGGRVDSAAEKKRGDEREHVAKVEREIREIVFDQVLANIDVAAAVHVAADSQWDAPQVRKELLKKFPKISGERLEALTLFALARGGGGACDLNSWQLMAKDGVAKDRKALWDLAKRFRVNADVHVSNFFFRRAANPVEDRLRVVLPGDRPTKKTPAKVVNKAAAKAAPPAKKAAVKQPAKKPAKKAVRK